MRRALLVLPILALAGCATPTFEKPGVSAQEQAQQEAKCRMEARKVQASDDDDDPLGNMAIGMGQYRDCMLAAGYAAR